MNRKLDMNSRIKDIYINPIGHDVIKILLFQFNKSEKIILNPIVKNIRIRTAYFLLKKIVGKDFFSSLLELFNLHINQEIINEEDNKETWWKEAVFYQIYPKSFNRGSLSGIIEKLDYIKNLGVDAIWLSPVYDSPDDDNGYDIRDYYKIQANFGTMEDFDELVNKAHKMGIRIIMDLVINHTSDEHVWFKDAIEKSDSKYKDYYFLRDNPNNWTSFFSGSAWNYYEKINQWGLHLFSKKQMDLNWENGDLRNDIVNMIRWWLEKGVDGFRLDVINYISKMPELPDGNELIGKMVGFKGIEHYFFGPKLHEYLKQIRKEAFDPFEAFSVGETPGLGLKMSRLMSAAGRKELDMIFSFDHLENPGHSRFDVYKYDLNYLKKYYIEWAENYGDDCWMSLFYENHDNPRMVSKIENRTEFRDAVAGLLAIIQMTLKGTPFIYQGQEMGLVNGDFKSIDEIKDIESINLYEELIKKMSKEEAFEIILSGTRDHSRIPIDWEKAQDNSTVGLFRELIHLRKKYRALIYGDIKFLFKKKKDIFSYLRTDGINTFYIECNLSDKVKKGLFRTRDYTLVKSNYEAHYKKLRPYEANIYIAERR